MSYNLAQNLPESSEGISIGEKQWACVNELANEYKHKSLERFCVRATFENDIWDTKGASVYHLRWGDWFPKKEHYPLKLLCKIAAYTAIETRRQAISTTQPRFIAFLNLFLEMLEEKKILIAEPGARFNSFVDLTEEDILLVANARLAKNGSLSTTPFEAISLITSLEGSILKSLHFTVLGASEPWVDVGVNNWVDSFKRSLGIEEDKKHFAPLTSECTSAVITKSLEIINDYGDAIVEIFDIVEKDLAVLSTNISRYTTAASTDLIIKEYSEKLKGLIEIPTSHYERHSVQIDMSFFTDLQRLAQSAALWIILLTTGLRSVDLRQLSPKCCVQSKRSDDVYYIVTGIKKTKIPAHVIPVPPQTAKAIDLAKKATIARGSSVLFHKKLKSSHVVNSEITDPYYMGTVDTFNKLLHHMPNHFGIRLETIDPDVRVTAHCGRSTLAGFIGAHSKAAILIIKKLFGHTNSRMPDAYINYNPLVIKERNATIGRAQESLAEDMANAVASKKVAGEKGEQLMAGAEFIQKSIAAEYENESLTEMDMQVKLKARLKEMLLERMKDNHVFALLTPMSVVCLRSTSDSTDSPCAMQSNHAERKAKGVSKEVTDAMATLPNPAQCVGNKCSDALIGDPWSKPLLESFQFYVNYLKSTNQVHDITVEAKRFVSSYKDVLEELYGDINE